MKESSVIISFLLLMLLLVSFINQADKTFSLTINVVKLRNSEGIVQWHEDKN